MNNPALKILRILYFVVLFLLILSMKPISSQEKDPSDKVEIDYNSTLVLAQFKPSVLFDFNEDRSIILTDKNQQNQLEKLGILSIYSLDQQISSSKNYKLYNAPVKLNLAWSIDAAQIVDALQATDLFIFVELDRYYEADGSNCYVMPNDSLFYKQWSFAYNKGTQWCKNAGIEMDLAWLIEKGDTSTIVCIIDSGIKTDHDEFKGRIWQNPKEVAGNDIDDDANGLIDDVNGWNYTNNDNDIRDAEGHGTSIAGIIAANGDNKTGLAGINWYCKIMPLKVLKGNQASYANISTAIYYAVAHEADVINISIGGSSMSSSLEAACKYAKALKVPVVVSMGNENTWSPKYPAAYSSTIAVGATDCNNSRSKYVGSTGSNYGEHIDIVAPGSAIISLSHSSNTNYSKWIYGTSFAAPHVVGVISLMKALNDSISFDSIKTLLFLGARDTIGPKSEDSVGWDQYFGHGGLNAFNTLSLMATGIDVPVKRNMKVESCEQYISPSGKHTWTSSGSYLDTIKGKVGCDTFVFANVVIHKPNVILDTVKSCGPFTSPSGRYVWKTSGVYRDTIFIPNKCDKIWLTNLIVHDINTSTINALGCDLYTTPSGKFTYNISGVYRDTLRNIYGCDSILTINLKINKNVESYVKITACRQYKSPSGQFIWNYSGKFKDVIKTKQG
jgi:thermitase